MKLKTKIESLLRRVKASGKWIKFCASLFCAIMLIAALLLLLFVPVGAVGWLDLVIVNGIRHQLHELCISTTR
jgi:hypothetical protein